MSRGLKKFAVASCLVLPLVISWIWGSMNRAYPLWDPARYFFFSGLYHYKLQHEGLREFLRAMYELRGWKPVLLGPLGALSLVITGGHALLGIALIQTIFFVIFLLFSFLTLSLALPILESAAGTLLLGLIPCFNQGTHYFGTEMPSLALTVGALYWLCRCWTINAEKDVAKAGLAFGLFLGIDLCIRPDQPIIFLLIPILAWLGNGLRSRSLRPRDIAACALGLTPFVWLFLKAPPVTSGVDTLHRILIICSPVVLIYACRKRLGLNPVLSTVFTTSYLLMAIWYAPFLQYLNEWLIQSSFGIAAADWESFPVSKFRRFLQLVWELGGIPFLILMVAAAVSLKGIPMRRLKILVLGFLTAAFPLLLGFSSPNVTIRYYFASFDLAFVLLLIVALSEFGVLKRTRQIVVALAVLYCLAWNLLTIVSPGRLKPVSSQWFNDYLAYDPSPNSKPDPAVAFVASLRAQFPESLTGERRIAIFPLTVPGKYQISSTDPFLFTNIALERDRRWEFSGFDSGWQNPDLILVGPTEGKRIASTPESIHAERILSTPHGKLSSLGLTPIKEVLLQDGEVKGHFQIYSRKPDPSILPLDGRAAQMIDALENYFSEILKSAHRIGYLVLPASKMPGRFDHEDLRLNLAASMSHHDWRFFRIDPKSHDALPKMDFYVIGPVNPKNANGYDWAKSGYSKIAEFTAKDENFSARFLLLKR